MLDYYTIFTKCNDYKVQLSTCVITNQVVWSNCVFGTHYLNSQSCNNDPILIQILIAVLIFQNDHINVTKISMIY